MSSEPDIIINGNRLTVGQAMTVRVALESLSSDLVYNGLGDDDHGKRMTSLYLNSIKEIRLVMYKENK